MTEDNIAIIIAGGKEQVEHRAYAWGLYTGSYYTAQLRFAASWTRRLYILSPVYGLLQPNDIVEPYAKVLTAKLAEKLAPHLLGSVTERKRLHFYHTVNAAASKALTSHVGDAMADLGNKRAGPRIAWVREPPAPNPEYGWLSELEPGDVREPIDI